MHGCMHDDDVACDKRVTMTGIAIHRIADGRLVEHWSQIDLLGLLQRLAWYPPWHLTITRRRSARMSSMPPSGAREANEAPPVTGLLPHSSIPPRRVTCGESALQNLLRN
jgi:hypothetical protein